MNPGGLSFFSPRFGLVCSNIISYEIVLASGTVTSASEKKNSDLWQALKGGANNFGIVIGFTARSFPATKIWSGFLYIPSFQAPKALKAFHEFVNRASSASPGTSYDENAAGPLVSFTYVHPIRIQILAANLVYTKSQENENCWPACWKSSGFSSLWRFWSTCKTRNLTSATDELNMLNPRGKRQGSFGTTTIKNDPATISAAHAAYLDAIPTLRKANIKDLAFTLVFQPLLPDWARKGDKNPLGLQDFSEPLVVVGLNANWTDTKGDELVKMVTRQILEKVEAFALANKTGHRFKYLNYCAEWQEPFEGYGKDNLEFLRSVSRKYDSEGLFQKGCAGGFKLGVVDSATS